MEEKKRYGFGLRKQIVLFTTILAVITYSTSMIFIYVLYPIIQDKLPFGEIYFSIGTLLLGIIWSGILAYAAAGVIIKPLQKLEKAALKAAQGDISEDIQLPKSDNEIRSLGMAFNQMLSSLRSMVQVIDDNVNKTQQFILSMSNQSKEASVQAQAIAETTMEIAAGAENSSITAQKTAEVVDDVVKIAEEVELKAKSSEDISGEMVSGLQHSNKVIQSLISGIETLADNHQNSLQTVTKLEQDAGKIEEVIKLVGDITAQTNLLALNASIEAARAGEYGRGFSVVAEEVRLLADQCADAVQRISSLIQTIQYEVRHVVEQISQQVETVNKEVTKGTLTNEALETMTQSVHEMATATSEISQLIHTQLEEIKAFSHQLGEVSAIAEETSAGTEEVTAAIQEQTSVIAGVEDLTCKLEGQAQNLKGAIAQFTL
nr:methyl-accepting chemotaxis protein [uncultured Bacillus sp.]